jgi:hypothetical protein
MANLSDASVTVTVDKVGAEFLKYARAVSDSEYAILSYLEDDVAPDADNNLSITGSATGRWAYSNNLEGYFEPQQVENWLGVNSKYDYLKPEHREDALKKSLLSYAAYKELCEAIVKTGGSVTIEYVDTESGVGFIDEGTAIIGSLDGEVTYNLEQEEVEYNVANFMQATTTTLYDAIDIMHGDEAADAYYEEVGEDNVSAEGFDTWYESYEG